MKSYQNVKGTMESIHDISSCKDTVYIRSNIKRIETDDFTGWEYDEIQLDKDEYLEKLTMIDESQSMALLVSLLMSENDMLKRRVEILEDSLK